MDFFGGFIFLVVFLFGLPTGYHVFLPLIPLFFILQSLGVFSDDNDDTEEEKE